MARKPPLFRICIWFITFLLMLNIGTFVSIADDPHDQNDGIWDYPFDDPSIIRCDENCTINTTVDALELNSTKNAGAYDLTQEDQHGAWWYSTYFFNTFLPPSIMSFFDHTFSRYQKPKLFLLDGKYASSGCQGLKRTLVHHFRFQLDGGADIVGDLDVNWFGSATNDVNIHLYYYRYYTDSKNVGRWISIDLARSDGRRRELSYEFKKDQLENALDDSYNIHLCAVTKTLAGSGTLNTDFINITTQMTGYYRGTAEAELTQSIAPEGENGGFYWEKMAWEDSTPAGTSVKYQLLYKPKKSFIPIPDSILEGNEEGFTNSPQYITAIPNSIKQLRMKIILSSDIPLYTPKVYRFTVTWQTNENMWKDFFNSTQRIDQKTRINHTEVEGVITIKPIFGDWPLAGHNPQNTRATEGKGPTSDVLNWYHPDIETEAGKPLRDPVIIDEDLYIARSDNSKVYYFKDIHTEGTDLFKQYPFSHKALEIYNDLDLENSPAITDKYVFVATGRNPDDAEKAGNLILAYDRNSNLQWNSKYEWKFDYGENIVYWASPVIYNDVLYITSWCYDDNFPSAYDNNKVLALDISKTVDQNRDDLLWEFTLPAESYSTPAVYDDIVFAGCDKEIGNNFFALDAETGRELWNASVGRIGRSSPVVYNDVVYATSHSMGIMKVHAFDYTNGSKLWTKRFALSTPLTTESSPAVYDNKLFIANNKGTLLALDLLNEGQNLWKQDYHFGTDQTPVSPAYSEGIVYVGFSNGFLYGLNADTGKQVFESQTDQSSPIVTSPVISNGLIYFCDANGVVYSIGTYRTPTKKLSGSLLSIPISLPQNKWWKTFSAQYNTSNGGKITFQILDEDKNILQTIASGESINLANQTVYRTIRLQAILEAENLSMNPELYGWRVTYDEDKDIPWLKEKTLTPGPWLTNLTYLFSINVKDNYTGLDTGSAQFTINYETIEGTYEKTLSADCSGSDGTTNVEEITIDLTKIEGYEDIIDINTLTISIMDLAGNTAVKTFNIIFDNKTPTSQITDDALEPRYTSSAVIIPATAADSGENVSGIEKVELYYRYATTDSFSGDWTYYDDDFTSPYSWEFSYGNVDEQSGYYEFLSNAVDNAGNTEQDITSDVKGDAFILFDPTPPEEPEITLDDQYGSIWLNNSNISSLRFSDDFLLREIEYQINFDTAWVKIASGLSTKTYDETWSLTEDYWDLINIGETYYLSFRITDSAGNTYITDNTERLPFKKDVETPQVSLELDEEVEWSFKDNFTITGFSFDGEGSGIKSMTLQYNYSEDGIFENETWKTYKTVTAESYNFTFTAKEGDGYYKFRLVVEDYAGNVVTSSVLSTGITRFPTELIAAFGAVSIILIILAIISLLYLRKQKK